MASDAAGPMKTVQGEFEIGSQYHFHLEPHSCLVRPLVTSSSWSQVTTADDKVQQLMTSCSMCLFFQEDGGQYEVICATQTVYKVQATVARALAMPENAFDLRFSS